MERGMFSEFYRGIGTAFRVTKLIDKEIENLNQ